MKNLLFFALSALFSHAAYSQVVVKDPWIRGTVAGQTMTGAFMQITSQQDAVLAGVHSPIAGRVEIHEMTMQDNVMKMREIGTLALPTGKQVELKPGGYHLMLVGLKQPVKEGDMVSVSLTIERKDNKRETVELKIPVRPLNSAHTPGKPQR